MHEKIEAYRYAGLINAIEFFSQRFDLEQLINYAYNFSKDLLLPNKIALWALKNNHYTVFNKTEYEDDFTFEYNEKYNQIVYFHAGLLYEKQIKTLLPLEIYNGFEPDFCIPLIMDKTFFGVIALKRSKDNPFNIDDETVAVALMNLYSTALTTYNAYKSLETTKIQLDEKIFNLFAINQSSRALLSELSLNNLCDLAISIFSELTQSSFTAFFIKDNLSEKYKLMSYKNLKDHKMELRLSLFRDETNISILPVLIDMNKSKTRDLFINSFYNGHEIIEKINPEYIVLLTKNTQLVGFVTLGKKVNDTKYESGIFELVESLAASTYIAINNSFYIEKIEEQTTLINNKLNELVRLNNLMKNINTAKTYKQVISLVMDTLNASYEINMGFFTLFDDEKQKFNIINKLNINESLMDIDMSPALSPLFEGDPILIYEEDKINEVLENISSDTLTIHPAGLIIMPVYINVIEIKLIGFFALLSNESKNLINDEDLLAYEAISTHIAPVIYQLQYAEKITSIYKPDNNYLFLECLKSQITDAIDFTLDLFVLHIYHINPVHFTQNTLPDELLSNYKFVYNTDNRNTFIITNNSLDLENTLHMLTKKSDYKYKVYSLNKEFIDYDSFIEIF